MQHMPSFDMTSFDFLGHFKDPRYNFKIQPLLSELFFCYKISILSLEIATSASKSNKQSKGSKAIKYKKK